MTVLELANLYHRLAILVHVGGKVSGKLGGGLGQDLVQDPDDVLVGVVLVIEQHAALVAVLQRKLEVGKQLLLLEAGHEVCLGLWVGNDVDAVSDEIVHDICGAGPQICERKNNEFWQISRNLPGGKL